MKSDVLPNLLDLRDSWQCSLDFGCDMTCCLQYVEDKTARIQLKGVNHPSQKSFVETLLSNASAEWILVSNLHEVGLHVV